MFFLHFKGFNISINIQPFTESSKSITSLNNKKTIAQFKTKTPQITCSSNFSLMRLTGRLWFLKLASASSNHLRILSSPSWMSCECNNAICSSLLFPLTTLHRLLYSSSSLLTLLSMARFSDGLMSES